MIGVQGVQANWVHDRVAVAMPPVLQRRACYGASAPWLQGSAGTRVPSRSPEPSEL